MEKVTALRQIANNLGLGEYPQKLELFYERQKESTTLACDLETILDLQEKYDLFGDYYNLVVQSAEMINSDPDMSTWVKTAALFHKESSMSVACKLPVPEVSENVAMNFMMLHIMMPMVPEAFKTMENRGFSWEELGDARSAYKRGIASVQRRTGIPAINKTYFSWLNLYCRGRIFKVSGFWFEIQQFPSQALWVRNRESGQIVPLMDGEFYRDGSMRLGSKSFEDAEGSFVATFSEDEENYFGYGCMNHVTDKTQKVYPKAQWECIARPGEYCLGMHIPSKADVSTEATMGACKDAIKLVRQRFPEYEVASAVFCATWLLNPRLKEIQGPQSKIVQFQDCFVKYPKKDVDATAVFSFVFSGKPDNLEDLEEDTSLQRKIKKIYLDGDCLHVYSGVIFVEE